MLLLLMTIDKEERETVNTQKMTIITKISHTTPRPRPRTNITGVRGERNRNTIGVCISLAARHAT